MRKIGILGGTFNPIHNGHVKMAVEACEHFDFDALLLIPSGYSYMKSEDEIADAKMRLEMAELAMENHPQIHVSDLEIKRVGPSYTCETIKELRETYHDAEFYFIIGADTLSNIEKWKEPDYIFSNVNIAVKLRDDIPAPSEKECLKLSLQKQIDYLKRKYHARITFLPGEKLDISSRVIRDMVRNNKDISNLVPTKVAAYIKNHHLYM